MAPLAAFLLAIFPLPLLAAKCDPTPKSTSITFDYLRYPCFRVCTETTANLSEVNKGSGWAHLSQEVSRPIFLPNEDEWHSLACLDPDNNAAKYGNGTRNACVGNRALLSLPSEKKKRIGTLELWKSYLVYELKALQFTVLSPRDKKLPPNAKAKVEIFARRGDGTQSGVFRAEIPYDTRTRLVIPSIRGSGKQRPFEGISVLEFYAGGNGFVTDDWEVIESAPSTATECNPRPTFGNGEKGPCKPSPTATKTFAAHFDDLPASLETQRPAYYKGVHWPYEYAYVRDNSNAEFLGVPLPITPHSGDNFLPEGPLRVTSDSTTDRFGVKSIAVLCPGPGECDVSLIGRRDPYEGSGRPIQVRYDTKAVNSSFKNIELKGFDGLWRFDAYARSENGWIQALWDTVVFTREVFAPGGAEKCRVKTLDQIPIETLDSAAPLPATIDGFALSSEEWKLAKSPLQPGKTALQFAMATNYSYAAATIQSTYHAPSKSVRLFDLDSIRITARIPPGVGLDTIRYQIVIKDQCGGTASSRVGADAYLESWGDVLQYWPVPSPDRNIVQKERFETTVFARPYHAISAFSIRVFSDQGLGFVPIMLDYWVNDIKYEWVGSDIQRERGCMPCGYRAAEWCEIPRIER